LHYSWQRCHAYRMADASAVTRLGKGLSWEWQRLAASCTALLAMGQHCGCPPQPLINRTRLPLSRADTFAINHHVVNEQVRLLVEATIFLCACSHHHVRVACILSCLAPAPAEGILGGSRHPISMSCHVASSGWPVPGAVPPQVHVRAVGVAAGGAQENQPGAADPGEVVAMTVTKSRGRGLLGALQNE
jgi:hypothetical protein